MSSQLQRSLRYHLVAGVSAVVLLCGALGGWAASYQLSGAIIAPGRLVIEGQAKSVQHLSGGVVEELLSQEGQLVKAGQLVVRLDGTIARANLGAITANLNQLYAREARLAAERDGLERVAVPQILTERLGSNAETGLASERRLFFDRRIGRQGQRDQLQQVIAQINEQIDGLEVQRKAKDEEIALIEKEMAAVGKLYDQGLITLNRMNNLDRSVSRLRGERGELIAQSAMARAKVIEIGMKLIDVDQQMRAEVASELRDVQNKQAELIEREVAAADQLRRLDILSPVTGIVHELAIHTVGGVVKPGEELMQIVPRANMTIEARIQPQDIDQLSADQGTTVRLTAFNRNTTPEMAGKLVRVSPDLEVDQKTGSGFYRASILIPQSELDRLGDLKLVPGMPAEVFIGTGDRTVLSYLMKPIRDHAEHVFRDE